MNVLTPENKGDKGKGKLEMNLINHVQIEKSLHEGSICYALVAREANRKIEVKILGHIKQSWRSFLKPSYKISQASCLPCETFNMLLI